MQFVFEAMQSDGRTVVDRLEAGGRTEAVAALRERGLIVLRLDEQVVAAKAATAAWLNRWSQGITLRDTVLLTRQLQMLLEAGCPLVPALVAAESQTNKPLMRAILHRVRIRVEEGESLSAALADERRHFDPVFLSMVAAGEATATLPKVFGRLAALAQQQQQARRMLTGALLYPAVLCVMLAAVMLVLLFFVVPRFRTLFLSLNSPLPPTTLLLFDLSRWLATWWPAVATAVVLLGFGVVLALHLPRTRTALDGLLLRLPLVGRVLARLTLAKVLRVWAAMLRSHVPLLETIDQSREAVRNARFLRMLEDVKESVSSGGRVGQALHDAQLADPIVVSAIRTGEENGRLSEAIDFVSGWVDEDNATLLQSLTRLAEPLLLALMGVVVGFVAMSLFLPLFDLATAG